MLITRVHETKEERWQLDPDVKTWRIPQCPFVIECSAAALEQVRREVAACGNLVGEELEVGGVLFGVQEPGRIRILACKPLPCEHAMGPGFVLSEIDEKRLAQLASAPGTDPDLTGLQALGWYHSHLYSRIYLSGRDLQVHSGCFGAPYQIAMVIQPKSGGPSRAGFFFQESSGEMRTASSYEEFTIEVPPSGAPDLNQPVVSKRTSSHRRKPSPVESEQKQAELVCPRCGSTHLRRSRRKGAIERWREVFGVSPYRCHECLSRSFLKTSSDLLERARSHGQQRPERRRGALRRTRREMLLWGCGILGFLAFLYFVMRETGPKSDQP